MLLAAANAIVSHHLLKLAVEAMKIGH